MSVRPVAPSRPLTVAEYLDIGEVDSGYTELVDGGLRMAPSPLPKHYRAARRLVSALEPGVPPGYEVLGDIDIDLQLRPPDAPGNVRRPDVMVVRLEASERVDREGGIIAAPDVLLAIEVVSPSSVRTDRVHKRNDYADAGIPHYWIVEISETATLLACHLAGEFGYLDEGAVTGHFATSSPFAVELNLATLR